MKHYFDHERLVVYQKAIKFVAWVSKLLNNLDRPGDVKDQIDRASTSIPLNIAEGNGKYSVKDRCRYFDVALGSAFECAACLDVLVAKRKLSQEHVEPGKKLLCEIVKMLVGLSKSISDRVYEEPVSYSISSNAERTGIEKEKEKEKNRDC